MSTSSAPTTSGAAPQPTPAAARPLKVHHHSVRLRGIFGDDLALRRRTIVGTALLIIIAMPLIALIRINIGGYNDYSITVAAMACTACLIPLLSAYTPSMDRVSEFILVITVALSLFAFSVLNGTLWAPVTTALPLLPLATGFLLGPVPALIMTVIVVSYMLGMSFMATAGALQSTSSLNALQTGVGNSLFIGTAALLIGVIASSYERRSRLLQAALIHSALHDSLTGLANRKSLQTSLMAEAKRLQRGANYPVSLMIIDIDHFKKFNDANGHQKGDAVLCAVADAVRACVLRATDITARYGGDEFIAVLPNTGSREAMQVAERLRACVEEKRLEITEGSHIVVTLSIGVATHEAGSPCDAETFIDDLLARADAAMYQAKHGGRNKVWAAPPASR